MMRRELPPSRVYLEPTEDPALPADAKARRERERAAVAPTR